VRKCGNLLVALQLEARLQQADAAAEVYLQPGLSGGGLGFEDAARSVF